MIAVHLGDLRHDRGHVLREWAAWTGTLQHGRRLDQSRRAIAEWLTRVHRPAVSVSGGKDSTLLLALVREQAPHAIALRADPPNPLPDRPDHVEALRCAAGGEWRVVPYPWDVGAVLDGEVDYPAGLKVRRLEVAMRDLGVDGVALGIRAAESSVRRMVLRMRGLSWQRADGLHVCAPLGWWPAEEVLGEIVRRDTLPLNPVYTRLESMPTASMEHLRDGTWWPHGWAPEQLRPWLARHYPDVVEDYDRALLIRWRQDRAEW